ncbi:YciI family protein [Cryptosporangium aurantiacum]|uniref:Uncharacterized conserved protein n=1 Tax=Cryptosporangium aurantiacum TaxID=134849 RepID=A0A1M7N6G3_9ACTN|nr:YciI family protein [Cryptosporangium aurantiacum]SHM99149.1 Uncharacterized conserved protein [Cryptosporangium aurantiacum]
MKFLQMVKSRENQGNPPQALYDAMGKYIEEFATTGRLVTTGGLLPTSSGATVRASGGQVIVSDGPFAEATEVVGGYAIVEYDTLEEAVAGAKDFIQLHVDNWPGWEGESEVRQIAEF